MSGSEEAQRKVRNSVGVPCGMNEYWVGVMYASFFQNVLVGQLYGASDKVSEGQNSRAWQTIPGLCLFSRREVAIRAPGSDIRLLTTLLSSLVTQ